MGGFRSSSRPRKLVIDTDPGIDDALAILFALACPEVEVVGLTSVFGNAGVDLTTRNAQGLLELARRGDIPVAAGAAASLTGQSPLPVTHIHGHDGMGDGDALPKLPARGIVSLSAAHWLVRLAREHARCLTILTLGPLTNLALALKLAPDLPDLVEQVVVMGGNAMVPGNATPSAEANMLADPEAADLVLGAHWPLTMVGLDVTRRVVLPGVEIDRLARTAGAVRPIAARALPLYRRFSQAKHDLDGVRLHDPTAAAWVIDPSLFQTRSWPMRVETLGISRGKTWPSLGNTDDQALPAWRGRPGVKVCTDVDADGVVRLLLNRLLD